jgi:alpha-galactosidase
MAIEWSAEAGQFHLRNDRVSYVVRVLESGWLGHVYFGAPLAPGKSYSHIVPGAFFGFSNKLGQPQPLEFPVGGTGDYRIPALALELPDGSGVLDLRYQSHQIFPGKLGRLGLPSTYVEIGGEAETLEVVVADHMAKIEVTLTYTIYRDRPVVVRSARIANSGASPVVVRCAMSASLDLPDSEWQLVTLSGDWARECHVERHDLRPGRQSVSSSRGASGHQHNPFVALARSATTEEYGEAYGFSLVYSGNFLVEAEVEPFGTTRMRAGINPDGFAWLLEPGAEFLTPEAVVAFSGSGLGDLSDAYHRLFRERLAHGAWRDRARPIVINNWEATYFDFDEPKLLAIASAAKEMGIELFVLDDGWFGQRNDDSTSLGDWHVNLTKLPGGLESLGRKVEALDMRFGIWIEPEMVSRHSQLFVEHPEWAIGIPVRPRTEGRNQLVLDMARPEVVDYLFAVVSGILGSAPISYVKWDMNRNITEPYSPALPAWRQGEFMHRYILGVYSLYDRLTRAFPGVLFESCAGGGGRFDPGMLAFAPQGWASDDTDAIERLKIQWGTSLAYPLSSISAHVSAVPNHQVGRITPLATRAAVAFFGVFGYELDPTLLSAEERVEIADQVAFYKQWRDLFQRGRFIRLRSPFEGGRDEAAWMTVADDARSAIAAHYRILSRPNPGPQRLRLRGLDAAASYRVSTWPAAREAAGGPARQIVLGGDELMAAGIVLESNRESAGRGDFRARLYVLEAI